MSQKVAMKRTETTGMPKNCLEFKDITFSVVKTRIDAALGGGKAGDVINILHGISGSVESGHFMVSALFKVLQPNLFVLRVLAEDNATRKKLLSSRS